MADNYRTAKVNTEIVTKAKKKGMSVNEYIFHLQTLVEADRTSEQENALSRMQALEGVASSMAESLKHQRFLIDSQSRKIDQLVETQQKITEAYGADVEFIQALKQEITK